MLHHKERHFDEQKQSFVIKHNIRGESIEEWVKQYQENETYRKLKRPDSVILSHEILSWHRDDTKNITIEKLEEMAREYIKLRNPGGMAIAVSHSDKQHLHIHFCFSGLEYHTGKSLRMSKGEFTKLKQDIQNFQRVKFPELSHSIVEHGKSEKKELALPTDREYQIKCRTCLAGRQAGRATHKEQVLGILKDCYHRAISKEDFFEMVEKSGMRVYERGGNITGVIYGNRKFRFRKLGFAPEILEGLEIGVERERELEKLREKTKSKDIDRGKEMKRLRIAKGKNIYCGL